MGASLWHRREARSANSADRHERTHPLVHSRPPGGGARTSSIRQPRQQHGGRHDAFTRSARHRSRELAHTAMPTVIAHQLARVQGGVACARSPRRTATGAHPLGGCNGTAEAVRLGTFRGPGRGIGPSPGHGTGSPRRSAHHTGPRRHETTTIHSLLHRVRDAPLRAPLDGAAVPAYGIPGRPRSGRTQAWCSVSALGALTDRTGLRRLAPADRR